MEKGNGMAGSDLTGNSAASKQSKIIPGVGRRKFLKRLSLGGAASLLPVGSLLAGANTARAANNGNGGLSHGDAALLRFPAALEIIEADFWLQYNELAGVQDAEVPGGTGNEAYTEALEVLDEDMNIYIHDNTDDEISHYQFLNAYLASKGAAPANLDAFRSLMGSTATGVNPALIGKRLTNLTQLTLDTSWWTRYRDDSHNPDLDPNFVFPQIVPSLAVNQHTAIPRTDADTSDPNFLQAIANTAAFHFPTIEQGGSSLYPSLALRATSTEVLRILISIGPSETMHFQTWQDKAGNAPELPPVVDPVTGVSVTFPDLEEGGELFQNNLIMPEPCPFLSRNLPAVSIIRPTKTEGAAMGALAFLTAMGLFNGQSPAFFEYMTRLARDADRARRGGGGGENEQ
jgi:hypothetical protein